MSSWKGAYKSANGTANQFDKILVYDWILDSSRRSRSAANICCRCRSPASRWRASTPSPPGGSIDALTTSLDDFSTSMLAKIAAFDPWQMLNFFRGPNLNAALDSSEQGTAGTRMKVRGFRPITDAPVLFGPVSFRDTQQAAPVFTGESLINALTGRVNLLKSTRYARARCRISPGTAWTFIGGIEPDFATEGLR
jgi:hypothetical protein